MHIQIFVPKKYKKVVRLDVTHYYSIIYVIIRKEKKKTLMTLCYFGEF